MGMELPWIIDLSTSYCRETTRDVHLLKPLTSFSPYKI
jgi:hypothetical protein